MKLSSKEAEILACVELDAQKSISKVRRETGFRDHTIRYHLQSLESAGIIQQVAYINLFALGYSQYNIFFSLGLPNKRAKEELVRYLSALPSVTWIAELGAEFPFGLGVTARQIFEVHALLNSLAAKFPGTFFEKAVATQFLNVQFQRKYLSKKQYKLEDVPMYRPKQVVDIDEVDHKVLSGMASIPHRSRRELASKLGMPLSSMELRIKKLEEQKVISGYGYAVDPTKLGMQSYKLLIFTKGISQEYGKILYEFARNHPNCIYLMECFGSWDYEINLEVEKPEDVVGITQDLYEKCGPVITSIKVLSKFRDRKSRSYPC